MLYGLMEGLAGVVDEHTLFRRVRLSPRWIAAGTAEATVQCVYGASGASFGYSYRHNSGQRTIALELHGTADVTLHVLLPAGTRAERLRVNGRSVPCSTQLVEDSPYADASLRVRKDASIELRYRGTTH
jgi:hypothetical protein